MARGVNDIEQIKMACGFGIVVAYDGILLLLFILLSMLSISVEFTLYAGVPFVLVSFLILGYGEKIEKLFLSVIDNTENGKFQITSDMMNLLGSSKENFYQLLDYNNYKRQDKNKDIFFYTGEKKDGKKNKFINKINKKNNPFQKLMNLNLK